MTDQHRNKGNEWVAETEQDAVEDPFASVSFEVTPKKKSCHTDRDDFNAKNPHSLLFQRKKRQLI